MPAKRLVVLFCLVLSAWLANCGDDDDGGGGNGNGSELIYECDDTNPAHLSDDDGDGFTECQGDCNDADTAFYPGAPDADGDRIDHNCDGPNQ